MKTSLLIILVTLCMFVRIFAQQPDTPAPPPFSTAQYTQHLAIIEGDQGRGSGFIAMFLDKPFLFTNSHVLSGNTQIKARLLNGTQLVLQGLSVADAYDVSIFQQETAKAGLEILKDVDSHVSIGDEVVVLGNSLGAGVVTELKGKITGIGPELIEVDAKFVSGNSGSPVIHVKTGKVIGIATFSTMRKMDGFGKDSKFNSVERRFAYRLDNIPAWHNTTWVAFSRESAVLNKLQERTNDIWNLAVDIAKNGKVTDWSQHMRRGNHLEMTVSAWQRELGRGGRVSSQQTLQEKKRLLTSVIMGLRSDLAFIKPNQFTAFNRKVYEDMLKDRELLTKYFRALEDQLSNDPNFLTR